MREVLQGVALLGTDFTVSDLAIVLRRGETAVLARKLVAMMMILRGEGPAGYPLMLEGLELEARQPASLQRQLIALWGAGCAVYMEDYHRARAVLAGLLSSLRGASALTQLPYTLGMLSELEFRTGNFAAALAAAGEAVSIAAETGQQGTGAASPNRVGRDLSDGCGRRYDRSMVRRTMLA